MLMANNDVFITKNDEYLFGKGTHYEIYEKMGAHRAVKDGKEGVLDEYFKTEIVPFKYDEIDFFNINNIMESLDCYAGMERFKKIYENLKVKTNK